MSKNNNNLQQKIAELNLPVEIILYVKLENLEAEANGINSTVTELNESIGEIKVEYNAMVSTRHSHNSFQKSYRKKEYFYLYI